MSEIVSRRALLRRLGLVTALLAGIPGARRGVSRAENDVALENCFWRKEETTCSGGQLKERWCWVCCWGLDCEIQHCEWRVIGPC